MAVRDGGSARKPGAGLITESDVEPGRPAAGSMLLCLSRGPDDISVAAVLGLRGGCSDRVIAGLRTRQGWAAPGGARKLLLGHAQQVRDGPGAADESFEGQQVRGSRLS